MSNPWDDRPWAEFGVKSEDELFVAVGKALSHWELLEQAIASLFTLVTVGSYFAPTAPALRAYCSVANSSNRIQMVRAAVESWLREWEDCPFAENALSLLIECSGWAGRRNDIAHGSVDRFTDDYENGWFLVPGVYSKKGRNELGKSDYRYNAKTVNTFGSHFLELHNQLNLIVSAMGEWHRAVTGQQA